MEVKVNKLPGCQVELEIKLSDKEFNRFIEESTLNLGKDLEIEGFRKGKAPKEIIEKKVGKENILVEAADLAVKENYQKAVLENKIKAISHPKIDILKLAPGNPFIFRAKLEVLPEIKLPDYEKIASKIKRKKISVEEREVNDALKWLQKSRAKFTLKKEPAQKGDFVEIEYCSSQIKKMGQSKSQKDAFILGEGHFIPGFEEELIGMKAGEKEFSLVLPKDYSIKDLAGKKVDFKVKMNSVQNVEFPEINDQFAKSLANFQSLEGLKKNIKEGMNLEKERVESQRVREEILEKISQDSKCEIPEVLLEQEKTRLLENLKQSVSKNLKIPFKEYLAKIKKTEKELSDSFLPEAQIRIKKFLILREIGERQGISVSEDEVKERTSSILKQYSDVERTKKELGLDPEKLKEYSRESLRNEKTFQFLENLTLSEI